MFNAEIKSLVDANKLPKVIEVILVERFLSDKLVLVSLFIITKLLSNSLNVQQYINSVT